MKSLIERIASVLTDSEKQKIADSFVPLELKNRPPHELLTKVFKDPEETILVYFDFEFLYKKYPRKIGKASGMKKLKKIIKNNEQYSFFESCLDNYIAYIKREKIRPEFILHFSTFVNRFKDYEPAETGLTHVVQPKDYSGLFEK